MDPQKLAVQEPCGEDWDRMPGDTQRRFCAVCRKHVHNLSAMTEPQAEATYASGEVCIRYELDAAGRVVHLPALAALGLALSAPAFASPEPQPEELPWWSRAAAAVSDWWWGAPPPVAPIAPPIDTAEPYDQITERHVTMGKPPPRPTPPREAVPAAAVSVTLEPGSPVFTSIEVACESGFRERTPLQDGKASMPGVPVEDCRLSFKGGPFTTARIRGGQDLTCGMIEQQLFCR
jgi:hypothetical protein